MAGESVAGDLPVKRPREEEENGVSVSAVAMETEGNKEPDSVSTVIPGWFSEISPMWPGGFSLKFHILFSFICFTVWFMTKETEGPDILICLKFHSFSGFCFWWVFAYMHKYFVGYV